MTVAPDDMVVGRTYQATFFDCCIQGGMRGTELLEIERLPYHELRLRFANGVTLTEFGKITFYEVRS